MGGSWLNFNPIREFTALQSAVIQTAVPVSLHWGDRGLALLRLHYKHCAKCSPTYIRSGHVTRMSAGTKILRGMSFLRSLKRKILTQQELSKRTWRKTFKQNKYKSLQRYWLCPNSGSASIEGRICKPNKSQRGDDGCSNSKRPFFPGI